MQLPTTSLLLLLAFTATTVTARALPDDSAIARRDASAAPFAAPAAPAAPAIPGLHLHLRRAPVPARSPSRSRSRSPPRSSRPSSRGSNRSTASTGSRGRTTNRSTRSNGSPSGGSRQRSATPRAGSKTARRRNGMELKRVPGGARTPSPVASRRGSASTASTFGSRPPTPVYKGLSPRPQSCYWKLPPLAALGILQ
ncbi:hypothetical protein DFP73DRAFT_530154 [Morchella snyderi]|nr:hypothetical protein DFP73DRAFT_530154 [Morchella snyderi]